MAREVFLDTAYAIALSVMTDAHHAQALQLAEKLEASGARLVTTRAVLLEIGDALCKPRYRAAATALLTVLEQDAQVEIVELSVALYQRGLHFYASRTDKEWGITDCLSFVLMHERNIQDALTTDVHFQQAGFQALLR